jgi:hypothetical protein
LLLARKRRKLPNYYYTSPRPQIKHFTPRRIKNLNFALLTQNSAFGLTAVLSEKPIILIPAASEFYWQDRTPKWYNFRYMAGDYLSKFRGKASMTKIWANMRQLTLWRRIFLYLVLVAMVGVAGLMLVAHIARIQLGREIVKISKAGEPVTFADLRKKPAQPKTTEDANSLYFEALRQIRPADLANFKQVNLFYRVNLASLPSNQFPSDWQEKVQKSLAKAEPLLANFDKASALELPDFDIGITHGNQVCRGRLDCVQGGVFLLSLRTLDLIRANNGDKAADSIISALKLMRVFDTYPTMIIQGRKLTCAGTLCSDIQLLLIRCRPSDKRLEKLQSVLQETFPSDTLARMLLAERVYQLEIARNIIPRGVVSRYLAADVPQLPERLEMPSFTWHRMRMFIKSVSYLHDMTRLIAISRLPWPQPLDELPVPKSKSSLKPGRLDTSVTLLSRLTAETLATVQCTATAVAIERYSRQERKIPASLGDISPRYIKAVPTDPFTGKSLFYTHDDTGFTVYSTGPNRVDDGGSITPKPEQTSVLDIGILIKRASPQ